MTAYNLQTNSIAYQSAQFPNTQAPILLFPTMTHMRYIDAGPVDIYTIQEYLNQINAGFQSAFNIIKTKPGFGISNCPFITYNPSSKLFSLICDTQFAGSSTYLILMNKGIMDKFNFLYSFKYGNTDAIYELSITNTGFNSSGTNLQIFQPQSTIYAFNDLTRIIFATNQIPVSGDGDGTIYTTNGSTNNKSINMITDICPDTTTLLPGSRLLYIPQGILRWYNLYAQQPFTKIDIQVYYETKDGGIHQLYIPPGEYFSVKLEFSNSAIADF